MKQVKQESRKIAFIYESIIENGTEIKILKDVKGIEKFRKIGWNDWTKTKGE